MGADSFVHLEAMKAHHVLIAGIFLVSASLVLGQGGKNIKPIPPELLAKNAKAHAALKRGEKFQRQNQLQEAIAAFREVVAIEKTIPGFVSIGNYALAKALTTAGRTNEALDAYKQAFMWDPVRKDLMTNGPPAALINMDYAILLAKSGKLAEAKAIYYRGLRLLDQHSTSDFEPIPFLVVFDADPTMVVWDLAPEKLIAAAKMVKAPHMNDQDVATTEEVRRMEPGWAVPVVYLATRSPNARRPGLYKLAEAQAESDEQRAWIQAFQSGKLSEEIGRTRRQASAVLRQAKLDIALNYADLAVSQPER